VNATELLVDGLAAARLAKLVTSDYITAEAREAVIVQAYSDADRTLAAPAPGVRELGALPDEDPEPPKAAVLVTCPWCVGMYVAAGVVAARAVAPRLWGPVARVLAVAAIAGELGARG
jgi:hypothetical protein